MKASMIVPNFDRQIEVVMESFNFENVHAAMVALDWTWDDGVVNNRVPTLEEIIAAARKQIDWAVDFWRGIPVHTGCGGFEVTINQWAELGLKFVVEGGQYLPPEDEDSDYFGER